MQTLEQYRAFIEKKSQAQYNDGFEPLWMPDFLFDFQKSLVEWAIRKGRAAIFADCGLGKTPMQLVWAENVVRKTNGRVLILAPLAVSYQTQMEAAKFGIDANVSRDGVLQEKITIANYEKMHLFNPSDFSGVVCDESGILKNYSGSTRSAIIEFIRKTPYRLLCSATPSPNDYTELGNSAEALGVMRRVEMLGMYFIHDGKETQAWRLKGHADNPFWHFVASWARAVRRPSDLGFDDNDFILPRLIVKKHIIQTAPLSGWLFPVAAVTLDEQRKVRRETINERCERVSEIANSSSGQFIAWCHLNKEGSVLASMIDGAAEVYGSQEYDKKEEILLAFSRGEIRALVSKPSICGHGMNWQRCHSMSMFPSHSHEQYYQAVRRCWRFGQKHDVSVHLVSSEAEEHVVSNLERKERDSEIMFDRIVMNMGAHYNNGKSKYNPINKMEIPSWL